LTLQCRGCHSRDIETEQRTEEPIMNLNPSDIEYIVAQLTAGKAVQTDLDPGRKGATTGYDRRIVGITGIESGSEYARWVADRAERPRA
jgi:hypothetical protein